MIEIQIDTTELVVVMQEMFPKEYTICIQRCHIAKLEAKLNDKDKENPQVSVES